MFGVLGYRIRLCSGFVVFGSLMRYGWFFSFFPKEHMSLRSVTLGYDGAVQYGISDRQSERISNHE